MAQKPVITREVSVNECASFLDNTDHRYTEQVTSIGYVSSGIAIYPDHIWTCTVINGGNVTSIRTIDKWGL